MNVRHLLAAASVLALGACGGAEAADSNAEPAASDAPTMQIAAADLPPVVVYKTASCGCCRGWVDHLREAGFEVDARDVADLMSVKRDAGVPSPVMSCHTALVDGYVVEGHVPAHVIGKLLTERPEVAGIAVPGMPIGSPGMEGPGARPYDVLTFTVDGSTETFTTVDPR